MARSLSHVIFRPIDQPVDRTSIVFRRILCKLAILATLHGLVRIPEPDESIFLAELRINDSSTKAYDYTRA